MITLNKTAYGEMVGKFIVGSDMGPENERALMGKIIGQDPALSLREFDIKVSERASLDVVGAVSVENQGLLIGLGLGYLLTKLLK